MPVIYIVGDSLVHTYILLQPFSYSPIGLNYIDNKNSKMIDIGVRQVEMYLHGIPNYTVKSLVHYTDASISSSLDVSKGFFLHNSKRRIDSSRVMDLPKLVKPEDIVLVYDLFDNSDEYKKLVKDLLATTKQVFVYSLNGKLEDYSGSVLITPCKVANTAYTLPDTNKYNMFAVSTETEKEPMFPTWWNGTIYPWVSREASPMLDIAAPAFASGVVRAYCAKLDPAVYGLIFTSSEGGHIIHGHSRAVRDQTLEAAYTAYYVAFQDAEESKLEL